MADGPVPEWSVGTTPRRKVELSVGMCDLEAGSRFIISNRQEHANLRCLPRPRRRRSRSRRPSAARRPTGSTRPVRRLVLALPGRRSITGRDLDHAVEEA